VKKKNIFKWIRTDLFCVAVVVRCGCSCQHNFSCAQAQQQQLAAEITIDQS
jgi:hypothetical protein